MEIKTCKNYEQLSTKACEWVGEQVNNKENSVLGLATGGTPEGLYAALVDMYKKGQLSFQQVRTFNLDEYIGLPSDHPLSYRVYMEQHLFQHTDILPEHIHLPDGNAVDLQTECERYEEKLAGVGGIDLQVLGLGHNGHIGFNEPGTSFHSTTHVVDLDEATRAANARFFDRESDVPKQAITMGIQTIMSAEQLLVLVSGGDKKEAVREMVHGRVSTDFRATVLQQHANVTVLLDEEAARELPEA